MDISNTRPNPFLFCPSMAYSQDSGSPLSRETVFLGAEIPSLKIRRLWYRLIFIIGIWESLYWKDDIFIVRRSRLYSSSEASILKFSLGLWTPTKHAEIIVSKISFRKAHLKMSKQYVF